MNAASSRDFRNLRREDLLDDYLKIALSRKGSLVATALRTKSISMRKIFIHGALRVPLTDSELRSQILTDTFDPSKVKNVQLLGDLGRVVLLQNVREGDREYGEALLLLAHKLAAPRQLSIVTRRVLIQHCVLHRDQQTVETLLDESPDVDEEFFGYLRAEIRNPFRGSESEAYEEWLQNFNRPFLHHGLAPVFFASENTQPFDNLQTKTQAGSEGYRASDPLVSVVLTTYKPQAAELLSSVRSILNQTWGKLELIVVDDSSGPDYRDLFQQVEELDSRVKVMHVPENRGTYAARNIGYSVASGDFITGQDDDDWSHPERLTRQVSAMLNEPTLAACRTLAVACDENMTRSRPAYKPIVLNASSLMVRRSAYQQAGAYLESRKAADTEYYLRLKKIADDRVVDLEAPLGVIRIRSGSLSRSDFSAGWRHPARTSFRSAYQYWHKVTAPERLKVGPDSFPPVRIPERFSVAQQKQRKQLDVVLAGDWQRHGGPQNSMLEEIAALKAAGYRVGVMNLEAARFMNSGAPKPLNDAVQKLINDQTVDEVFYDDIADVRLLILRYPPILQFFPHEPSSLTINSMVILANQAPSELDGSDIRYLVDDCHANAKFAFGVDPQWVPQGPQVRDFLSHYIDFPELAEFDLPGVLDIESWWHTRLWYRSTIPVVGRHSRDDAMKWPADKDVLTEIYPVDGTYDIRVMGGNSTPLKVLGTKDMPAAWLTYKKDALPVPEFLYALDYFVFYQHPLAVEAFGRVILEALASGVVVILPKHFERVFGAAALYADVNDVQDLIKHLHTDFCLYKAQLEKSWTVLNERFSYSSYRQKIETLLKQAI